MYKKQHLFFQKKIRLSFCEGKKKMHFFIYFQYIGLKFASKQRLGIVTAGLEITESNT
jgi:hypothetical protein